MTGLPNALATESSKDKWLKLTQLTVLPYCRESTMNCGKSFTFLTKSCEVLLFLLFLLPLDSSWPWFQDDPWWARHYSKWTQEATNATMAYKEDKAKETIACYLNKCCPPEKWELIKGGISVCECSNMINVLYFF